MHSFIKIIHQFPKKNILVIGDVILDQYIQGSVSRISPEAPVPIVLQEKSFYTCGGAANVASNLRGLGSKVTLVGRIGADPEGHILKAKLAKDGISTKGIFVDKKVPTICKIRVIAQHQQVVRIDREKAKSVVDQAVVARIVNFIKKNIDRFDAVIVSDYGKGLITAELVNFVRHMALEKNKIITIDPKVEHFGYYRDVTGITPNLKETENAIRNIKITSETGQELGIRVEKLETNAHINLAGTELLKYLNLDSLLITLGEHGMRLFEKGKKPFSIDTKAREVYDVSGAGDTVISTFTLSLAAGASKRDAANLANWAAGIVVGKMGAVAVTRDELLQAVKE